MLHQLPRLFKQLEFIEPDEACDFGIEILSGKTQGMYHWVSSNLLWLEGPIPTPVIKAMSASKMIGWLGL